MPFTVNLNQRAGVFGRFDVAWTPTVLALSRKGQERLRLEGYHDRKNFNAWLRMALGRIAFMGKHFDDAIRWYREAAATDSQYQAEAMYWQAVAQYNQNQDPAPLVQVAQDLHSRFPGSIWSLKTEAWMPEQDQRMSA
ncbi:MAG TPA: hypothetical protein VM328_07660 [Fimbriimonadaceae bacterium]|nr:hypothetical protein [Fimbriimonadaceae bacterium]